MGLIVPPDFPALLCLSDEGVSERKRSGALGGDLHYLHFAAAVCGKIKNLVKLLKLMVS